MPKKNMNDDLLEHFNRMERHHWWWEGRRELVKSLLGRKRHKRILDVGCGTGETLSFLGKLFPKAKLYGIDSSQKAINFSKSRGHKEIIKANAIKLPFKDNFFDAVLILDVLEHIKDDQRAINEAKKVLKKDGKIIITSPGLSFIWSPHDEMQGHQRRYTRREMRKLAKEAGMEVSFISYFNFFLSPLIVTIRLLSRIKRFSYLASYDRGINFEIANKNFLNSLLRTIFMTEIKLLRCLRYPFGISIAAVFEKT